MSKLTLAFKGKVLKVHYVQSGEILIGSDPSCDIHIDSLAIQPRHASITTANHKSTLRDLSDAEGGTFVNAKRLESEALLKHDDEIRVGKHTLLFTTDPVDELSDEGELAEPFDPEQGGGFSGGAKASAKHAWLQILNGANVGKTLSLNRNLTNLGKSGV
ncbi:MAG TPA: FHA domain-containing protein, partial [Gammaproteobacteria bacterium]